MISENRVIRMLEELYILHFFGVESQKKRKERKDIVLKLKEKLKFESHSPLSRVNQLDAVFWTHFFEEETLNLQCPSHWR